MRRHDPKLLFTGVVFSQRDLWHSERQTSNHTPPPPAFASLDAGQ